MSLLDGHTPGPGCKHDECRYLRAHRGGALRCRCEGTLHGVESDWSEYSFGHSGGPVFFETVCDGCGEVVRDPSMLPEKSARTMR